MTKNIKYVIDGYSLEGVRNRHETRVVEIMKEEIPKTTKFCGCTICIEDVYAMSLNSLTPRYQHTHTVVLDYKGEDNAALKKIIIDQIKEVSKSPNHS